MFDILVEDKNGDPVRVPVHLNMTVQEALELIGQRLLTSLAGGILTHKTKQKRLNSRPKWDKCEFFM